MISRPPGHDMIRWEPGVLRMGDIFKRPGGWYVRYIDVDGRRKCRASHQPTRELARRYLIEVEARIARGKLGIPPAAAPAPTVAALCERFLREYSRPRIKDLARYRAYARAALRRVLPYLGSRPADAVTAHEVGRARDALGRDYSAASVRTGLSFLAAVYAWAVGLGLLPHNPLRQVERPSPASALEFYSAEEVATLLRTARARAGRGGESERLLHCCLELAVHTGLRKGELLGLRHTDLDLDTQRLTVARSYAQLPKSGRPRHLRLPSACLGTLRAWQGSRRPPGDGRVFPVHAATLDRWTRKLLADAGVRALCHPWHALRHTFASHFIMAGGNLLTLQKILGHSDVKMTMVYAHLAPDFLAQEMERVRYERAG
jgi:integrase